PQIAFVAAYALLRAASPLMAPLNLPALPTRDRREGCPTLNMSSRETFQADRPLIYRSGLGVSFYFPTDPRPSGRGLPSLQQKRDHEVDLLLIQMPPELHVAPLRVNHD